MQTIIEIIISSHYWKIHKKNVSTIWKWTRAKVSAKGDIVRLLTIPWKLTNHVKSSHVIAATLKLIKSEIAPFDPPTLKTVPYRTKHDVDRMTLCRDVIIIIVTRSVQLEPPAVAIVRQKGRSSAMLAAGPQSLLHPCRGRSGGSRWSTGRWSTTGASPLLWRPLTIPRVDADL